MVKKHAISEAQRLLGGHIERWRLAQEMTRKELAKKMRETWQQIEKYERGEFIPISTLEKIAQILGTPIQKRVIRRISKLRSLEIDAQVEQKELIDLYNEAFPEIEDQ